MHFRYYYNYYAACQGTHKERGQLQLLCTWATKMMLQTSVYAIAIEAFHVVKQCYSTASESLQLAVQ
jgi:hypothetical protein